MGSPFSRALRASMRGEVIIPALQAALCSPSFDSFEVPTTAFHEREIDYWFHPSTHPMWGERLLYFYMTCGADLEAQVWDPTGVMAVTQGNFWHSFLQRVMLDSKIIKMINPEARYAHDQAELFVCDEESHSRGWMDGVVSDSLAESSGLELKTMSTRKSSKCPKGAADDPARVNWIKENCAEYYAQAQEYLRMSGFSTQRFLIVGLEHPFTMIEIAVPYDPMFAQQTALKYRSVLQAVADQEMPPPCCGVGSVAAKECPARLICPVGRMTLAHK